MLSRHCKSNAFAFKWHHMEVHYTDGTQKEKCSRRDLGWSSLTNNRTLCYKSVWYDCEQVCHMLALCRYCRNEKWIWLCLCAWFNTRCCFSGIWIEVISVCQLSDVAWSRCAIWNVCFEASEVSRGYKVYAVVSNASAVWMDHLRWPLAEPLSQPRARFVDKSNKVPLRWESMGPPEDIENAVCEQYVVETHSCVPLFLSGPALSMNYVGFVLCCCRVHLYSVFFSQLAKHLPPRTIGYPWTLAFGTAKHGMSIKTLYRAMQGQDSPVLMVIKDSDGQARIFFWYGNSYQNMSIITVLPKPWTHCYTERVSYIRHLLWERSKNVMTS